MRVISAICGIAMSGLLTTVTNAASINVEHLDGFQASNIVILGKLEVGDETTFKQTVLSLIRDGRYVSGVKLFTPGGSVYAATNIGEQIRTVKGSTEAPTLLSNKPGERWCQIDYKTVLRYNPGTRTGDPRCECASACFLIWAAGVDMEQ